MNNIQTIAKSAYNFVKKLEKLSKEYKFQIGEYNSYPISFRFRKNTPNIEVTMHDLDFAFKHPKSISILDLNEIDSTLKSEFSYYYQPVATLRVNFGEMIEENSYDYDMDDEIYETYDRYFKSYHSVFYDPLLHENAIPSSWKNAYDNNKIQHNFTIEYDHGNKELIVITSKHYYESEKEIYKLRKTDEYIDEIYTTFYKVFFNSFPKEVERESSEFSIRALNENYKTLCEHVKSIEQASRLFEKPKINLAYYSSYKLKNNHASLYSYTKGYFSLVSQPTGDYSINVYDTRCKLDRITTIMNPLTDNGDELYQLLYKKKLTKNEKFDTYAYFTKLAHKYITSTFKKSDYINDYDIKFDLQINDVNVTYVEYIPNSRLLLVYDDNNIVGNITGELPKNIDTKQLAINLQKLLDDIRNT